MGPTSYQAAPPRDENWNLREVGIKSTDEECVFPLFPIVFRRRFAESIENFLVAAHHSEFLACYPFLRDAVALHEFHESSERVDLALQGVYDVRETPRTAVQHVKVACAVPP